MNKQRLLFLIFCLLFIPVFSQAQFNSDAARKSIVRIYVRVPGESTQNVCTGFIWKQQNNIVTSLHAMKASAKITIVYPGKELRPAKIIKIIKDPDLVMLETYNADGSPLTLKTEAVPLTNFTASTKNDLLHALGFWSDAASSQVIDIKHADFDPEKLDGILPEQYKKQIIEMTFPSIYDPIYGLNGGSLLPGFSGSPVFNSNGNLVSIGDGGIEAGALNVSWSIPASNLDRLSASNDTALPSTITHVPFLYSAEVSVPVDSVPTNFHQFFQQDDISLYQTKTRTYEQMKTTAWDTFFIDKTERMLKIYKTKINYNLLNFDVYQIPGGGTAENPGFVVTIPAGSTFYYDNNYQCIGVDFKKDSSLQNYGLYYFKIKNGGWPLSLPSITVRQALNQKFGKVCGGFQEPQLLPAIHLGKGSKQMRKNRHFEGGWERDQLQTNSNSTALINGKACTLSVNASYVYNKEEVFCTVFIQYVNDADEQKNHLQMLGSLFSTVDCTDEKTAKGSYCSMMKAYILLYSAMVLTSVNNVY